MPDDKSIMITGEYTVIYGYLPDKERKLDLTIAGNKDIKLKSFSLSDYLEVETLTSNRTVTDSAKMDVDALYRL